jgi:two-component system NarL family sensor kinase
MALLLQMEERFLERLRRLYSVEQRLTADVRGRREGSGRRTIRQIERERQRLGRELHTDVGQMLAAIHMQLDVIDAQLPEPPPAVLEALQKIGGLAHDALEEVRQVSRRIHPPEWQRLRLEDALRQLWSLTGIDRKFETQLTIEPLVRDPAVEVKSLLFRAAQEGIANVLRHAHARRIELSLRPGGGILTLRIRDDGVGFDAARTLGAPANLASGIGLRSIREQTDELNGKLSITSGPLGTTLDISVPWTPGTP